MDHRYVIHTLRNEYHTNIVGLEQKKFPRNSKAYANIPVVIDDSGKVLLRLWDAPAYQKEIGKFKGSEEGASLSDEESDLESESDDDEEVSRMVVDSEPKEAASSK